MDNVRGFVPQNKHNPWQGKNPSHGESGGRTIYSKDIIKKKKDRP